MTRLIPRPNVLYQQFFFITVGACRHRILLQNRYLTAACRAAGRKRLLRLMEINNRNHDDTLTFRADCRAVIKPEKRRLLSIQTNYYSLLNILRKFFQHTVKISMHHPMSNAYPPCLMTGRALELPHNSHSFISYAPSRLRTPPGV